MKDILRTPEPDAVFQVNARSATADAARAAAIRTAHGRHQPVGFQEIWDWTAENKPHDLQLLRVFLDKWGFGPAHGLSLSSEAPDRHTPAPRAFGSLLEWCDAAFPKVRRGIHPRLDLGVTLSRYQKVREGVRRSIRGCMGAYEERAARNAQQDSWAELLGLLTPLTENDGPLDKRTLGLIKTFADIARRAGLESWDLVEDLLEVLEDAFVTDAERELAKRAIRTLNEWNGLVDFEDLLPPAPIPSLPVRRQADALPPHVETRIAQLVEAAATRVDLNTTEAHDTVTPETRNTYRAALRYHVKLLPHCPPDPLTAYDRPITDLDAVNDINALFAPEHLSATIRATEDREHLPSAPQPETALSYYKTIRLILARNADAFDPDLVADIRSRIRSSEYFKGLDRDEMPEHIQDWCRGLVNDPEKERRFHNLHLIFHAKAKGIMKEATDGDGVFHADRLADKDRSRLIRLGVCAAVCAIVLTGRPLRLRNAIWLRHRGRRANINPRAGWEFFIPAEEAKAGKRIPEMCPREDRKGPQVLDWYLRHIRPLIDPKSLSIYLFPSIRSAGGRLDPSTYRGWFQAAANDAGIPMTFHRFRHGFASILIRMDVPMRVIADMLGNTEAVCSRRYAFLDPDQSAKQAQDAMAVAAAKVEVTPRTGAGR